MVERFQKFKQLILDAKTIVLSTHVLPDGDGLGAQTALFHYLRQSGKKCQIYNPDSIPKRYQFLDPQGAFIHGPNERKLAPLPEPSDLWIIVDTNDPRRVGALWQAYQNLTQNIVFLDHHLPISGTDTPKLDHLKHCLTLSDPTSSSIGELLYHVFRDLDLTPLNERMALGLYVSVMTDTNSFRASGTTPLAHRIAAEMIERGVNPEETYQAIYSTKKLSHVQLLGKMLDRVSAASNGKIAWMQMTKEIRNQHDATSDDTMSFLNLLLLIQDTEVVCLFRQEDDLSVRVSIKSKGRLLINHIASDLGGGGHEYAAGAVLSGSIEECSKKVINRLEKAIALQKI